MSANTPKLELVKGAEDGDLETEKVEETEMDAYEKARLQGGGNKCTAFVMPEKVAKKTYSMRHSADKMSDFECQMMLYKINGILKRREPNCIPTEDMSRLVIWDKNSDNRDIETFKSVRDALKEVLAEIDSQI